MIYIVLVTTVSITANYLYRGMRVIIETITPQSLYTPCAAVIEFKVWYHQRVAPTVYIVGCPLLYMEVVRCSTKRNM